MISFEILRERPKSPYTHVRDIIRNRAISLLDPVQQAVSDEERLRRQHALAEGEKVEPLPPRFTNPNPGQVWVPAAQQKQSSSFETTAIVMGKLAYNSWMARMVYPKFQKGCFVTLRSNAFVVGAMPHPVWEVIDLQEIHYMANMDRESREPKVVGCWTYGTERIPTYYPPARLRTLQPEEVKVYCDFIRDKEAKQARDSRRNDDSRICGEDGNSAPADAGENS